MKRTYLIIIILLFVYAKIDGQSSNNNTDKGAIKVDLPRTPESQSFEKYGKIPVNESTGTVALTFPLMTLKGKKIEIPITLSYHASGIKVSQEATWVGLGFDIIAGGRISVETKGNIDENFRGTTNLTRFKTGLKNIFERRGKSSNTTTLGYGFLDYMGIIVPNTSGECPLVGTDVWDDDLVVSNGAWYGVTEPDIYHANFMGQSVDFYIDLVKDSVCLLNEKTLCIVSIDRDQSEKINSFSITDNNGIIYKFEQKEKTKVAVNNTYGVFSIYESTSAWLLTKMTHPSGETINFTYTNFGKIYPMFNWSASITTTLPEQANRDYSSTVWNDNQLVMDSYYLTKIESDNAKVDFILDTREDIRGDGARKLNEIKLSNKTNNAIINDVIFSYSYFVGNDEPGDKYLPIDYRMFAKKRLKLLSFVSGTEVQSPVHKFFYDERFIPGKLSYSQDHWGYYNSVVNSSFIDNGGLVTPHNLIPTFQSLGNLASKSLGDGIIGRDSYIHSTITFDGIGDRNCSAWACKVMMLDSIVYPTNGSTKLEFEPHTSFYRDKGINEFVGGGIRIKSIKTYKNQNFLDNSIDYKYELYDDGLTSGIYLGSINYMKIINKSTPVIPTNENNSTIFIASPVVILSSNGDINANSKTVGYNRVKIIYKNNSGSKTNGYTVKQFWGEHPYQTAYENYNVSNCPCVTSLERELGTLSGYWNVDGVKYLDKSGIAPTPNTYLEGKLFKEDHFNAQNNLVQSINYYYHQADYSEKYYSMRVEDNYNDCFGKIKSDNDFNGCGYYSRNSCPFGYARWALTLFPAKSYYTLTDSIITKTYDAGGNFVPEKKSYRYNYKYQPCYEIIENSDGTKKISYTKRIYDFENLYGTTSGNITGDVLELSKLLGAHMVNTPIELIDMQKKPNADTLVTFGTYYKFTNKLVSAVYKTNLNQGVKLNQQFIPSFTNSSKDITIDGTYKLDTKIDYNEYNQIKQMLGKDDVYTAYLWGYNNQYLVARVTGTDYATASSKVTQTVLDNPSSDAILQTELNKLRTIPNTQVISYTYMPYRGITSIADLRGVVSSYTYDALGRLILSRNNDNNITGKYSYIFQSTPDNGLEGFSNLTATITTGQSSVVVDSVGSATANTSGGSGGFNFSWYLYDPSGGLIKSSLNSSSSNFTFTSSTEGSNLLQCIITDIRTGQIVKPSKLITIRPLLNVTMTTQLYSGSAGRSSVAVTGGSGNYTYSWYLKDHSDNVLLKNENTTQNSWYFGSSYVGPVTLSCKVYDTVKMLYATTYYDFTSH